MLCYSDLVVAFFEALASDPSTAATTGRFYLNTTSHVVKWYANSAWHTAMDLDTAQTATNKTFTSPVINSGEIDNSFVDGYLDFNEESAPSTPSSGKVRLYAKTDKKFWYKDSAGVEAQFGASGSGELNLIENPSDSTNWSSTGWSSAVVTTTTAGDLPLGGIVDTAIQITSDTSAGTEAAEYVSYAFTTPASLATKLKVEFWMRPGSNFIASEWTVSVYQSTTRQSLSTDASSVSYLPNAAGKFTTTFDCVASTAYTLRFARPVNAGANAGVLNVANVVVGPGIQPQGAVVSEWQSWTPTGAWSANTTYTGKWRRVGANMEMQVKVAVTGAPTSASLTVNMPTGYTIDTTALVNSTADNVLGSAYVSDTSTNTYPAVVKYSSTSAVGISYLDDAASGVVVQTAVTQAAPFTFASGDFVTFTASLPVAEWAGSGTLNVAQNDVEYAYNTSTTDADDTTSFAYGPAGGQFGNFTALHYKDVQWQTPQQNGDRIGVQITNDSGATWHDVSVAAGVTLVEPFHSQNTVNFGIGYTPVSTTKARVYFGIYRIATGATYGAAGTNWSAVDADPVYRWRAYKVAAGAAVGFGVADTTSAGLVPSGAYTQSTTKWTLGGSGGTQKHRINGKFDLNGQTENFAGASASLAAAGAVTLTTTIDDQYSGIAEITCKKVGDNNTATSTLFHFKRLGGSFTATSVASTNGATAASTFTLTGGSGSLTLTNTSGNTVNAFWNISVTNHGT